MTTARDLTTAWRDLDTFHAWTRNPRRNDAAAERLALGLVALGWTNPVLLAADDEIVAGHTRTKAARILVERWAKVDAEPEGSPWHRSRWHATAIRVAEDRAVPVIQLEVSGDQAHAIALADNRYAQEAEWDQEALALVVAELAHAEDVDADALGFDPAELEELAALLEEDDGPGDLGGGANVDEVPDDVEGDPVSVMGEIYQLGPHRLRVGDSTEIEAVVAWLAEEGAEIAHVLTDPPFAIYGSSTGLASDVADDKMIRPFFRAILRLAEAVLPEFGTAHVCCDWRSWPSWWDAPRGVLLEPKNLIVWDKGNGGLGSNYANCHELVGYFVKMPRQKVMKSHRRTGIQQINRPNIKRHPRVSGDARNHNASKPVAMLVEILAELRPGDVLEPFAGGGSTLIACSKAGRRCFAIDLEPREADKVRRRWTRYARANGLEVGDGGLE